MEDSGAGSALRSLLGTDLSVTDHDQLAAAARAVARIQSFVDLAKLQISRRTRQLGERGDTTAHHVLVEEGRLSGKDAQASDQRDRVCEELPQFEEALADGRCTAAHVDSVAHHTKDLTNEERADLGLVVDALVDSAETMPIGTFDAVAKVLVDSIRGMHRPDTAGAELERQRKASKVKRWTDRASGMKHTLVSLDPVRDASLWTAINHHLERIRREPGNKGRPFAELQVDAILAATSSGVPAERIPEIVIHIDHETLCHGPHADSLCETVDGQPIPAATAQQLCCEAILTAVLVNPDGTVDRLCEDVRTANRKQRRMLAAMYSSCAHPHCDISFSHCRIHHIEWFSRGGKTVLANLVPLCEVHHHLVHEGGWNLELTPDRRLIWLRPDGEVGLTAEAPNRTRRPTLRPDRRPRPASTTDGAGTPPARVRRTAATRTDSNDSTRRRPGATRHRHRASEPDGADQRPLF